jgi:hypothetical protein
MSQVLSLPTELVWKIAIFLPLKDLRAFSLTSSAARQLVIPSLFHNVRLPLARSRTPEKACDELNSAVIQIK